MTDENHQSKLSKTYTAERRRVERRQVSVGGVEGKPYPQQLYFVTERSGMAWTTIGRGYPHSTSAYARLGRLTANQAQSAPDDGSNRS